MTNPQQGIDRDVMSYPIFRDWRDQSRDVFAKLACFSVQTANILAGAAPEEVRGRRRLRRVLRSRRESAAGLGRQLRSRRTMFQASIGRRAEPRILAAGVRRPRRHHRTQTAARRRPGPSRSSACFSPGAEYPEDVESGCRWQRPAAGREILESRGALGCRSMARLQAKVSRSKRRSGG